MGRFEGASPIIFGRSLFAELGVASRQIHFLKDRIEREHIAIEQVSYFWPTAKAAERVEALQEKIAGKERFLERDRVKFALVFGFAVQPAGQRRHFIQLAGFPPLRGLRDQSIARLFLLANSQIDREQFLRRPAEGMP